MSWLMRENIGIMSHIFENFSCFSSYRCLNIPTKTVWKHLARGVLTRNIPNCNLISDKDCSLRTPMPVTVPLQRTLWKPVLFL